MLLMGKSTISTGPCSSSQTVSDYQMVNKLVDPENRHCFNGNSSSKADDCQGQQVNLPEGNSFDHGFDWNYLSNFSGIQKNMLIFLREQNDQHILNSTGGLSDKRICAPRTGLAIFPPF